MKYFATILIFICHLHASSYIGYDGKIDTEGMTINVHFADIYNVTVDPQTKKVNHLHWANSNISLTAHKGYGIANGAHIIVDGKTHLFANDKQGFFSKSDTLDLKGHCVKFTLVYALVKDKKTSKMIRKTFGVSFERNSLSGKLTIKEVKEKKEEKPKNNKQK